MARSAKSGSDKATQEKKGNEKSSHRSAEFVDSDDNAQDQADRTKSAKKRKADGDKVTKDVKDKAFKMSKSAKATKPSSTSPSKSSSVPKSSKSGGSSKINGSAKKTRSPETSSSDVDADSVADEDSGRDEEGGGTKARSEAVNQHGETIDKRAEFTKDNVDFADEVSSGASSKSSESDVEMEDSGHEVPAGASTSRKNGMISSRPAAVSEFKPPKGFTKAKISTNASVLSVFSAANLKGKQIWHIAVPSTVPLSKIKELSVKTIEKGEVALSHKGNDYGFIDLKSSQNLGQLLVPAEDTNSYKSASQPVARALNVHQIVTPFRDVPFSQQDQNTSTQRTYTKPKPQQPAGLRTRHRPFGVEASDDETVSQTPQFRVPIDARTSQRKDKRKASAEPVADETKPDQLSKKKRKKDHPQTSSSQLTNGSSQGDSSAGIPARPKHSDVPIASKSKSKHENETPEEKAARRAARSQRKAEKK